MAKSTVPVVLQAPLKNYGFEGEVVCVKPGFARNYLFPNKLAVFATEDMVKKYSRDASEERKAFEKEQLAHKLSKRFERIEVQMYRHKNADETPHSVVTAENICEKLFKQQKVQLEAEQLVLPEPINAYGLFGVSVKLTDEIS
eukprot:CAMPEP_0201553060 /NCGR_PEP_ID=MMETSP0173_2-20130828/19420_1 /ASSEMBLY_ACC=CAM_ASM_000268 /TAXON_ID=218659 /ORGANISM="Vexillifera sp., Strain DIVA3 564/2" /LENGTH=142 /DNA_ID=CAMNT_0047963663 /DNA_START=144 /DNA_END=568 /DNA_ORIENTATION=-